MVRLRIALAHRAHLGARTLLRRRAARHLIAPLSSGNLLHFSGWHSGCVSARCSSGRSGSTDLIGRAATFLPKRRSLSGPSVLTAAVVQYCGNVERGRMSFSSVFLVENSLHALHSGVDGGSGGAGAGARRASDRLPHTRVENVENRQYNRSAR